MQTLKTSHILWSYQKFDLMCMCFPPTHSVSDLKKKCILNLSGNSGSKQVGRTLKHFSKFSDEKWRKFFFSLFTL